jgi:8-oxo-dGTP pyrophosphatase MutT (NUDIX family)
MSNIKIASGPVIVLDGKVLLNKSGIDSFWKFCGGWVEAGDLNLLETARREAKEEMGIDLKIVDQEPFLLYTSKKTKDGDIDIILVHYLADVIGEIIPGEDVQEWSWVDVKDLAKENLAPNILPTLRHFGFIK